MKGKMELYQKSGIITEFITTKNFITEGFIFDQIDFYCYSHKDLSYNDQHHLHTNIKQDLQIYIAIKKSLCLVEEKNTDTILQQS